MFWLITAMYVIGTIVLILSFHRKIKEYTNEIDRLNRSRTAAYERGRRLGRTEGYIKATRFIETTLEGTTEVKSHE